MNFFTIPNLSSSKVSAVEVVEPPAVTRPAFKDKEAYRKWCADLGTEHVFVSVVEGLSPHLRVSAGNPAWRLHGLVGEYDGAIPKDWYTENLAKARIPPEWATRTFSGRGRVYWSFATPIDVSVPRFAEEFLKVAYRELRAKALGPGFESAESSKLTQYFEAGTEWARLGGPIPDAVAEAWKYLAAQKVDWSKEATVIPIERIRSEAEKRWPGRWPGGWGLFDVGARGIRFWDASADAASVMVTEAGCVCHTGDKGWVTWSEIFGAEWVRKQSEDIIGTALTNLWCEPCAGRYWRKEPGGKKVQIPTRTDLILHLTVAGLSPRVPKGELLSEIDRAIYTLQRTRTVDGIHPAFYAPEDVVQIGGRSYLNTSTVRPGPAAPDRGVWGKGFPWLAKFIDTAFRDQKTRLIAWFAHQYQGALAGRPTRGCALFVAGNSGIGKTYLSSVIAPYVFGGREDASSFLLGDDGLNANLLGSPLWTVDDAIAAVDRKRHLVYSQIVKHVTANDTIKARGMYREGYTAPWNGRLIITLNLDAESLGMLPSLEISSKEKMIVFRMYDHTLVFPAIDSIMAELPFFCAYLRDFVIPDTLRDVRFGVKGYQHPDLATAAAEASDTMGAEQLLDIWRRRWFAENPEAKEWSGTATDLMTEFERYESLRGLANRQIPTINAMGRYVSKLEARGEKWISRGKATRAGYRPIRISKPDSDS